MNKPLVFDIFCGLMGWGEAFSKAGYNVVGFDIEDQFANFGEPIPDNCTLVLRDVRSLTGVDLVQQYGVPACIVASPPCQEFSYMAMPWTKAKQKEQAILSDESERRRLTDLFNQCFRIQREVSAAAGQYVPIIIENVRGAQKWVGKARWNFGSFYLWGDVPALMPIPGKVAKLPNNNSARRWEDRPIARLCDALRGEGYKTGGMNWSDCSKLGQDFTRVAGMQSDGVKGFTPNGQPLGKNVLGRKHGSKSLKRKEASAKIAKIPPILASWIAKCFKPQTHDTRTAQPTA